MCCSSMEIVGWILTHFQVCGTIVQIDIGMDINNNIEYDVGVIVKVVTPYFSE